MQKYSDATIRAFNSIFLQKSLIAFKHHLDKAFLRIHIVELLLTGYGDNKNEQTRRFIRMFSVYLMSLSSMTGKQIREAAEQQFNNNLKSEAMSLVDELIEEGKKEGLEEGLEKGKKEGLEKGFRVIKHWQKGMEPYMIANLLDLTLEQVNKIILDFQSEI